MDWTRKPTFYELEEIRQQGDCAEYIRSALGAQSTGRAGEYDTFNVPWRNGSNSGALHACKTHWVDWVTGNKGDIFKLAQIAHNVDFHHAHILLGEYYRLTPIQCTKDAGQIEHVYDYKLDGVTIHQTVRMRPKAFWQRRPDPKKPGEYIKGLGNVERILYRVDDWKDEPQIIIVGGEKDADALWNLGLKATTCPMGEGSWRASYNRFLTGKAVIVIPDNDPSGKQMALDISDKSLCIAKSMRVVDLGMDKPGADISDWIEAGGTREALEKMIAAADELKLNVRIRNFEYSVVAEGGKLREVKVAIPINSIVRQIREAFDGFPKLLGEALFDFRDGKITMLRSASALEAWVAGLSDGQPEIETAGKICGCSGWRTIYESLVQSAEPYIAVSSTPHYPARKNIFYTHDPLPEPSTEHEMFEGLMDFFSPTTAEDGMMIRALFACPMYYSPDADRPLWVIDSDTGQDSGKTKLVELLAYLYDGTPFYVDARSMAKDHDADRMLRALLTIGAMQKRVFLLDNVTGYFQSSALATMATSATISGLAPYGKDETTRENDMIFCLTSNSACLDRDLVSRSMMISLSRDECASSNWLSKVRKYVQCNRMQILADIRAILAAGPQWPVKTQSRFREWEYSVMAPIIGYEDVFMQCHKLLIARREMSDQETADAETVHAVIELNLARLGIQDHDPVWIASDVLADWARTALPGLGGKHGRGVRHHMQNWAKLGQIEDWNFEMRKFPTSSMSKVRCRGAMARASRYDPAEPHLVRMVTRSLDGEILAR
ncbi:MAG: hypothetical protein OEQ39_02985 [Gammaproteobacteria bacterium]|nr:hypothetical protein [Gammaproteobacteria bacterium]MDH3375915.1 hypothetical protein [Gammaproteobacteria bacterium]